MTRHIQESVRVLATPVDMVVTGRPDQNGNLKLPMQNKLGSLVTIKKAEWTYLLSH